MKTSSNRLETAAAYVQWSHSEEMSGVVRRMGVWFDSTDILKYSHYLQAKHSMLIRNEKGRQKGDIIRKDYCASTTPDVEKLIHLNTA